MSDQKSSLIEKKSWDKSLEPKLITYWDQIGLSSYDINSSKPHFVIDTPPPYPSGRPWHIGAAAGYSQIDMIARASRMSGKEVLFPVGIDRNGLPVELYTEKKYNVSIRNTPREKFLELCAVALDDLEAEMVGILRRMGLSGDFQNKYRTDSENYRKLTQETFLIQWRNGRVYLGTRPTNYCVDCGTTIADAEIEYVDLPSQLVFLKFGIEGSNESLIIASTRPELICSCQAVIVNPEDDRYKTLIGKSAILPFYERKVPIIAHPSAEMTFGTGAVMICSYGDYEDAQLFRELGLQEIIAIDLDGRMNQKAGEKLKGLKIKAAKKTAIQLLQEAGLVEKITEISHRTPMCDRSKTPIEIIPLEEYYMKVVDEKDDLRKKAREIKFHPNSHRQLLLDWIDVALDWPVTRRRFYGTEVPIWYCKNCEAPYAPPLGKYYQPWKENPPGISVCQKCGSKDFRGDTRTFDTWVDSSVSALYISKYGVDEKYYAASYPNGIRPQGKDIVRTWLHYSLLRCYELTGKSPWPDVWIHGMGLDEKGEKMSKSKGNIIDPIPVLEQYGADCFRLWAASEVSVGSDFNISVQKIAGIGKFLTKLWNISRFIAATPKPENRLSYDQLCPSDKWILSELSVLIDECLEGYRDYNFFIPANKIRDFTWNTFAAHYIELSKGRAYGQGFSKTEQESARFTLYESLKTLLLLLAPVCPFISEEIWLNLYSKASIHKEQFPEKSPERAYSEHGKALVAFNSLVWNEKKAKGVSLKEPIKIEIPSELVEFAPDLKVMHNIQSP